MLRFVVTPGHGYTYRPLCAGFLKGQPVRNEIWTYPQLFQARRLPPGAWVFSDLERLANWELALAGEIAVALRTAGPRFRVYNDPAVAACRYELLLRLHRAGINRFRAWRAEDGIPEARYPVFVRQESSHQFPLTRLLDGPDPLQAEIDRLAREGIARRGLLIIEYEAEELKSGIFRKYAAYRFGDRIVADHMVHDIGWVAKLGHKDAWSDQNHLDEAEYVRTNPHAEILMRAFDLANIDYGRADYGVIGGKVQIWEINTNPTLPSGNLKKLNSPLRIEATLLSLRNRTEALRAMALEPQGRSMKLRTPGIANFMGRQSWLGRHLIRE